MLLKLRNRPERRLQAVPAPTIRNGVIPTKPWSWHRLQARREHGACPTKGMPLLAARRSVVAPPEASRRMAPSTWGVFVCWRSWKRGAARPSNSFAAPRAIVNRSSKISALSPATSMSSPPRNDPRPTVARASERLWERRGDRHPFVLDGRAKGASPAARFARRGSKRSGEPTATLGSVASSARTKRPAMPRAASCARALPAIT